MTPIRHELLEKLRCPEDHSALRELSVEELVALNAAIAQGELVNGAGHTLDRAWSGAVIREDGRRLYPLSEEGVLLLNLQDSVMKG